MALGMSIAAFANETCRSQIDVLFAESATDRPEVVQVESVDQRDVRNEVDVTN